MENLGVLKGLAEANTDMLETWVFYILAAMAIPFAFGVVLDRAVIRAGFLLIGVFGAIAGIFLLLQAQFLGMAQVMIYAVGITLVVVIALMLTNPRSEDDLPINKSHHKGLAFLVAFLLFVTIYMSVRSEYWPQNSQLMEANNVAVLGRLLTTTYALPFEFASVLLLAALIGAIMLAKAEKPGTDLEYSEIIEDEPDAGIKPQSPEVLTPSR